HGAPTQNSSGGNNCKVTQLPVTDGTSKTAPSGDGWYYDNFSDDVTKTCPKVQPQRVAFTAGAKPPTGVTVKLDCLNETQVYEDTRTDLNTAVPQPEIGSACGADVVGATVSGDAA